MNNRLNAPLLRRSVFTLEQGIMREISDSGYFGWSYQFSFFQLRFYTAECDLTREKNSLEADSADTYFIEKYLTKVTFEHFFPLKRREIGEHLAICILSKGFASRAYIENLSKWRIGFWLSTLVALQHFFSPSLGYRKMMWQISQRYFFRGLVLPDSAPFRVIVEHPVLMVPNDVFRGLADNLLDNAFELDGAAPFVVFLGHLFVAFIHDFNLGNWEKKKPKWKSLIVCASWFNPNPLAVNALSQWSWGEHPRGKSGAWDWKVDVVSYT